MSQKNRIFIKILASAIIVAIFLLLFFLCDCQYYFYSKAALKNLKDEPFEIHFIDVGLGDSIFIRFPNDQTMLVDCGPDNKDNDVVEYLSDLFSYEHIFTLDYLVFTHTDEDHIGKGVDILEKFDVENIYRPKCLAKCEQEPLKDLKYMGCDTIIYNDVITACYAETENIFFSQKGITFAGEDFKVEFLSPKLDSYNDDNNYSPMIMIEYNGKRFLLTGDGETEAENEVADLDIKADVLKVGHHGSKTSSSEQFISKVMPSYAVISVSEPNRYDFPHQETIATLEKYGAEILKTSTYGTIVIGVKNGEIIFAEGKGAKIDLPILVVCSSLGILIICGVKIPKKNKKR